MSFYKIPFHKPGIIGKESRYMTEAIAKGKIGGDGTFTQQCSALLERRLGVHKALLTTSCTHALELAALLLEINPGDEVIVPSFTFSSTVNAFVLRGARPVFIDVTLKAIKNWRFRPMIKDGERQEVVHELTIYYRLQQVS